MADNKKKNKNKNKTYIGGQAVIEGVMMRGKNGVATAVRDKDGVIRLEAKRVKQSSATKTLSKIPVIRGAINFFVSLVSGTRILMRSAEVYGEEEGEPSKFEKWLSDKLKIDATNVALFFGVALGLIFSIGLFFVIPHLVGELFNSLFGIKGIWRNLIEGAIRILIFVCYILLTSLIKDVRRTYMYHGAEHKTITCYEKGLALTVDNVRACRRVHDRCGTTFLFIVMIISILVFSLFGAIFPMVNNGVLKLLCKLALLPVVAGVSYEVLKLLAKTDSPVVYPLKAPGLALQRITTREPDDEMIEVAIAAFEKALKMDENPDEPECDFVCAEKVENVVNRLKEEFSAVGIDDGADAEWLVCSVTGLMRDSLKSDKTVSASDVEKINKLAAERKSGRPLWYVLGTCNFYGYDFKVDERALIPRPETEELVEKALKQITKDDSVLDLCTGSGAIAVTVYLKSGAGVTASDISDDALSLAKENAEKLGAKVDFIKSDLFNDIKDKFSVIITNPPYIKSGDIPTLQTEVKDFEPHIALDGGDDGLDFYRRIAADAESHLFKGGAVFCEVGDGQAEEVAKLFGKKFLVEIFNDLEGVARIVKAVLL